jgi:hypothetical protein
MLRNGLACLSALSIAACTPASAADPPAPAACPPAVHIVPRAAVFHRPHSASHSIAVVARENVGLGRDVGVAWGLAPGAGQLGAAGLGYYAGNCWSFQIVYDRFGNYVGEQPTNICVELHSQ